MERVAQTYFRTLARQPFNRQLDLATDVNLNIKRNERQFTANIDHASRIVSNVVTIDFNLKSANQQSPLFMVAYTFFKALQTAQSRMSNHIGRNRNVKMTEAALRISINRADGPPSSMNRLAQRLRIGDNLRLLVPNARGVLPEFTPEALNWLAPLITRLLSEEEYNEDGIGNVQDYASLIDQNGVLPPGRTRTQRAISTQIDFKVEVICFYNVEGTRALPFEDRQAATRRLIYARANHFGGGKRKMFYRGNEVQFHTLCQESLDCLGNNPLLEGEFCFPMAFLCSQVREYNFENDNCTERRSKAMNISAMTMSPSTYPFVRVIYNDRQEKLPEFVRGQYIYIFNPIKPSCPLEWEKAAKYLHSYVEMKTGNDVDYTAWDQCPQTYADVFGVIIHLFIKGHKSRFDVYVPKNKQTVARHIYMYCENDHFQPVIDIRKFTNSKSVNFLSYCDYCQKSLCPTSLKETKVKHFIKCHNEWKFTSEGVQDFLEQGKREPALPVRNLKDVKPYCKSHYKFDCSCDDDTPGNKVMSHVYECTICNQVDSHHMLAYRHRCYFQTPKPKPVLSESKLFVLDIESLQEYDDTSNKYVHEFVLMCVRNVYDENIRYEYTDVLSFCEACKNNPEFENATFIAHNGGGYDYQFMIKTMEENNYNYTFVPRPSSDHKYISVTMTFQLHSVNFIDFMCLIPGSLKGIAQSFQLETQKGDFPHRFLKRDTLRYIGRIPPIDSEDDFYSLGWKKSEQDRKDVHDWYKEQCNVYCSCGGECTCMKKKWDCFAFLTEYCWLDVDVLANACQKYRTLLLESNSTGGAWNPKPIDPFQYLTQSQLAMQIFLTGFDSLPKIGVVIPRPKELKTNQFIYYHRLQEENPDYTYIHYGTNSTRYMWLFEKRYIDCYCLDTATVHLFITEEDIDKAPELIEYWEEYKAKKFIGDVVVMYEHDLAMVTEYEINVSKLAGDRDFFYGGRTEVFSPYAKPKDDEEIKYLDVCSLYPTICSFAMLPIGHPEIIFGSKCLKERLDPNHNDPYFGFIRCKVIPNKKDLLGLLPSKLESGKLVFDLNDKIGMWFTEEIYLAMKNGYVISEIYEVHHFDSDNRSDTLMRGYMESFLTLKQESEGWKKLGASSDNPSEEEKDEVIRNLFESNGNIGKVRKEVVKKNPVLRQVSKIFLNCLWGKFCQRKKSETFSELTSYKDYEALLAVPESKDMVFRQMNAGRWRIKYNKPEHLLPINRRYNIYLAAGVTAQARCYLHRQMLNIGPPRILYCDTDSIVFLNLKASPDLTGIGLGKWTDEHPGEIITEFFALAPKCYMLNIEDELSIKAKGCIMSLENQKMLTREKIISLLEGYCIQKHLECAELQNFSIFTNSNDINYSYGTMFSRYNSKQIRCVLNKRNLIAEYNDDDSLGETISRVSLLPEGYLL